MATSLASLNVTSLDEQRFDPAAIEIAQEVASSLAVAIRQAQLRERVERYANELEDRVVARTADLERSENRLAAILNALPDLVFVVDDEGRYVEILTSREDLLYRAAEEMKGPAVPRHPAGARSPTRIFGSCSGRSRRARARRSSTR